MTAQLLAVTFCTWVVLLGFRLMPRRDRSLSVARLRELNLTGAKR